MPGKVTTGACDAQKSMAYNVMTQFTTAELFQASCQGATQALLLVMHEHNTTRVANCY